MPLEAVGPSHANMCRLRFPTANVMSTWNVFTRSQTRSKQQACIGITNKDWMRDCNDMGQTETVMQELSINHPTKLTTSHSRLGQTQTHSRFSYFSPASSV